ncbi:MAG: ArsB/NhaD family transporter [Thermoplasmata archaeon]
MSTAVIISILIFTLTYIGIIHRRVDRAVAAVSGAVAMILAGTYFKFYSQQRALEAIDFNTIGLLMGMMILVGVLGETGFFKYVAIKTAKLSKGSYYRLFAFFVLITALTSAFLDNVTTILLMVPITITIAKDLNVNPTPFIISEVMASNIGGTATLIGDPPNIMIGSSANINFTQFLLYLAPIVLIVLFVVLLLFEIIFKDMLDGDMNEFKKIMTLDENQSIVDWRLLKKTALVLLVTMILFLVHHILGLDPWMVAITGASLLLLLTLSDMEKTLNHVHWTTLIFFLGLFIIIGGLISAGVIDLIANRMVSVSENSLVFSLFMVIMIGGGLAIAVGNIPASVMLIPAVASFIEISGLGAGYPVNPLWWALALGTCFGGNGTLISAPTNLIAVNMSEKMGYPISFRNYARIGLPITLFILLLSFFLLYGFYVVLLGP